MFQRPRRRNSVSTSTPVRHRPSLDFSLNGLVYCSMMLFMGMAALNTQANLLFGVFGLMIGILLISGVISRVVLRKMIVHRVLPEHAVVGQTATVVYEFANAKRYWPSLSICLAEIDGNEAFTRQPQVYMLHAAAGMSATVPAEVVLKRRGVHELDRYQLATSFPFGFIKRATVGRQRESLVVFPALGQVDQKVLAMCRSAEKTGASIRPRRGGMDEFYGVKEYRQGENPRWIHWRRSARTGVLVAKEMTQVAPPRLLLLVDTCVQNRTVEEHVAVEKAIAMAATLASAALEQGLLVGMFAWSGEWTGVMPNRGKRQRRDLLALLARLPLNEKHPTQDLLDQSREFLQSGTTPVLLTPRDVQLGLSESRRGSMLVISGSSAQAQHWFRFDDKIDFSRCMPPDQQPTIVGAA